MQKIERIQLLRKELSILSAEKIEKLVEMGYFECPSSTKYHGAYAGGNFDHSFAVANILTDYTSKLGLTWERPESPKIVGYLHDLAKVDDYVWTGDRYEYNTKKLLTGHGDKSVILALGILSLTDEEIFCIRYHMGAFTDKQEWAYYNNIVKKYPNVLYTHTADMLASQVVGL